MYATNHEAYGERALLVAEIYQREAKQASETYQRNVDVLEWIRETIPDLVLRYIVDPKELKQCGTMSQRIANKAIEDGLKADVVDSLGHITVHLENEYIIDATHLQSEFPFHGSLRDFNYDERNSEEFVKMKKLFDELAKNPMKGVKITKV